MNRKRLIVVLELEIYIYDISTMKLLHTLDTGANPNGRSRDAIYDRVLTSRTSDLRPLTLKRQLIPRLPRTDAKRHLTTLDTTTSGTILFHRQYHDL